MEIKNYKRICNLIGFLLGIAVFKDIMDYPFLLVNLSENSGNNLIPQGIFVLGLISLLVFYATILQNIKKKGVFIRRNEVTLRYFGFLILSMGLLSDILFAYLTGDRPSGPRILAILGGTLVFVSYIFKIGIKIQEEQEFTI